MKLATIEIIKEIIPIDGADFIESARVQGYFSVIKKNEYKVGDKIIFIQPDSLIPRAEWNKFLWPKDDQNSAGNPIRIIIRKFKKQISQGLIVSTNILPEREFLEGDDLTTSLNIEHYEKPIPACLSGKIRGNFPNFIKKTDEPRLLSYPEVLNELKGKEVYITQKANGSSMTVYNKNELSGVCSRNLDLLEDENNSFWKVARQFDLINKIKQFGFNSAIQSELIGEGIQGNNYGLKGLNALCFNIFDIDNYKYLDYKQMRELCNQFGIPIVKVIYEGIFNFSLEDLQKIANEQKYPNGNLAEGIVIRCCQETHSDVLNGRLSVKIINENFALKFKE